MTQNGLIFERVIIYGDLFPPQSSIRVVLSKIGKGKVILNDDEIVGAKQLFSDLSNTYTQSIYKLICPNEYIGTNKFEPRIVELLKLNQKWISLLKTQVELVDRDFTTIVQCLAVMEWYRAILGGMGAINLNLVAEETSKMLNVYNRKKPLHGYKPNWKFKEYKQPLLDYPDFASAYEYFSDFSSLILENIGHRLTDSDSKATRKGVTLLREIQMELSAIDLSRLRLDIPPSGNRLVGFCSNCMTNYLYDREVYKQDKKTSSLCPRPECQKGYSVQTTRKSRGIKSTNGEKKIGFCKGKSCQGDKKRMLTNGLCSICVELS